MARTFNQSQSVFLAGPIEYWWDTEEDPDRFKSDPAVRYRKHRDAVREFFVQRHFLVYSPHTAFKGDWNEKMQPVNDFVLGLCDIVVDMRPNDIPDLVAEGTQHEIDLAREQNKILIQLPPLPRMNYKDKLWYAPASRYEDETFNPVLLEMILETKKMNGWKN